MKKFKISKLITFLIAIMIFSTWACIPKKSLHVSQGSPHQEGSFLKTAEIGSHVARSPLKDTMVVESHALNLRTGPSMESSILGVLKRGAQVTILNSNQKWVEVTTQEGRIGWVFSDYLTDARTSSGEEGREKIDTQNTDVQKDTSTSAAAGLPDRTIPKPAPPETADATKYDRENLPPPNAPESIDETKSAGPVETISKSAAAAATPPTREQEGVVFADPKGFFQLRYPVAWQKTHGLQYEVEQFRLQSPSTKLEFWVLNTKATDGYTLPQFYTDMVTPLKQLYGEDIEIRPLKEKESSDAGWLQGHVTLKSGDRATYDYVMTENAGRFWVIMEIQRPGAPQGETEALAKIKSTFSFSEEN
jgi:uncharacterized protein YgiM (DUF1202 family)